MSRTLCQVKRLRLFSSFNRNHATAHAKATCQRFSVGYTQKPNYHHIHLHNFFTVSSSSHLQNQNNSSSTPATSSISPTQPQPFSSSTLLITEAAKKRLQSLFSSSDTDKDASYLRISVEGGGCSGFQYKFEMDSKKIDDTEDIVLSSGEEGDKGRIVIDKPSLDILKGSKIDYQTELIRSAFRIIDIPAAGDGCSCGASFTVKID